MILVIDNYDSFTYNLVHYVGACGEEVTVKRNDEITLEGIQKLNPDKIIISPGPCTPNEAGISMELVKNTSVPLLGVCLGHQSIGSAFGAKIIKAPQIFHGKISQVEHSGERIFNGIMNPYSVVRYHSLIIDPQTLPDELKVTCTVQDDPSIIMGIEHISKPIFGVQFHPESIETDHGMQLIKNFLTL
ncbi:aminodeoxychorismate/anthranilate synthase component II [Gammaproteobacteria bacterium]|nr:aminodeoxychorismate/anthranilate synthase component II [Gammaproteobacteria bacterium]MDA8924974.1 aminodeoxychorismate/anthranilate synthase component II [Gammaproteobacteria bacterium]MDA9049061.1 aminodeoxychorismate/anthranilate synthase component II [Gammaproteobacteria bacterium]MDA9154141.1 aminodeoxychorismate/anthranilate synthase component II [Gammaproteobacteria bacterium]MDA9365218.1 aminodeoxychorismate/anthranilate synthase component II [Gammaproteobacteria bacterium]